MLQMVFDTSAQGVFLSIFGEGPSALWFGNFISVKQQIGKMVK